MRTEPKVCMVCQVKLNLTRRQINAIAAAIRGVARNRYFVPDDEVYQIIHKIHTSLDTEKTEQSIGP